MSGSRHHRRQPYQPAQRMPRVVGALIVLAVGCVGLACFAVFAPTRAPQPTAPSPTSQTETPATRDGGRSGVPQRDDSFGPRFPVSLTAMPERVVPATPPNGPLTGQSPVITPGVVPQSLQQKSPTDDALFPDLVTAREFAELYRALSDDDYLAIHIALNDFTTMPDDCEPLIRELARTWTERHVILTNAIKTLRAPLNLPNPVGGQPAAIISANRTGVMLSMGTGSQQVPWNTWSRADVTRMWNRLAELQGYRGDTVLVALLANWLAEDMMVARVAARRIDKTMERDESAADSMATLAWSVERWLAVAWWEARQEAVRSSDQPTLTLMNTRLTALERLKNPRIDTLTAQLLFSGPASATAVTSAPAAVAAKPAPRALPGFAATMVEGNWSQIATGARCSGAGSLVLEDLTATGDVNITFTPRQFRGTMSISLKPYECVLDLDRSVIVVKGPRGISQAIPVTVFPRQPNVMRLRFASKGDSANLVFNHDPAFLEFPLRQRPDQLCLAQTDGDLVINSITRGP